jgi:hypothetical protein
MTIHTVAIHQPYIFPYTGYFSLVETSDIFIFYDDVQYINRGWINRNSILINGTPYRFTVPLSRHSQNDLIYNTKIRSLAEFREKFLETVRHGYTKAPYFEIGFDYIARVLSGDSSSISEIAINSVEEVFRLTKSPKRFLRSSASFASTRAIGRSARLIKITKLLGAENYVNAIAGVTLHDKTYFSSRGVNLSFVKAHLKEYKQVGSKAFVPGLSIIDVIMNIGPGNTREYMRDFELM